MYCPRSRPVLPPVLPAPWLPLQSTALNESLAPWSQSATRSQDELRASGSGPSDGPTLPEALRMEWAPHHPPGGLLAPHSGERHKPHVSLSGAGLSMRGL